MRLVASQTINPGSFFFLPNSMAKHLFHNMSERGRVATGYPQPKVGRVGSLVLRHLRHQ
jgi:hypothetical protein